MRGGRLGPISALNISAIEVIGSIALPGRRSLVPVNNALLQAGNSVLRLAQLFDERLQRVSDGRTERRVANAVDKRGNVRCSRSPLPHDIPALGQVRRGIHREARARVSADAGTV